MKKTLAKILTSLVITLSASNISQGATFNVDYNKNIQLYLLKYLPQKQCLL